MIEECSLLVISFNVKIVKHYLTCINITKDAIISYWWQVPRLCTFTCNHFAAAAAAAVAAAAAADDDDDGFTVLF